MALHVSPRLPPWTDANARWTPARLGARPARPQGAGGERPAGDERTGANPIELSAIRSAGYHRSGEERTPLSYPTYFQRLTRKKGLVFEQMYVQGPRPIADSPNSRSSVAAASCPPLAQPPLHRALGSKPRGPLESEFGAWLQAGSRPRCVRNLEQSRAR